MKIGVFIVNGKIKPMEKHDTLYCRFLLLVGEIKLVFFNDNYEQVHEYRFPGRMDIIGNLDTQTNRCQRIKSVTEVIVKKFPFFDQKWLEQKVENDLIFDYARYYKVFRRKEENHEKNPK